MADPSTLKPPSLVLFDPKLDKRFQVREICHDAAGTELAQIQFDEDYREAAEKKFHHVILKASDLSAPGANILKQTCLSLGAEAGVHRGAINCTIDREAVLITATQAQLERLLLKLRPQPFSLKPLAESIIRMRQRQKRMAQLPLQVMAILNVTPDSFSDGGRLDSLDTIVAEAGRALELEAHILDVGGESTRPGAKPVSEAEEIQRVVPAIKALRQAFPETQISIDTRKATVARAALDAGATMINDISGGVFDPAMLPLVAEVGCSYVLMHSQDTPETMQDNPTYTDVVGEICAFFYQQTATAVDLGVNPEQLILDPGFGFGKTLNHNLTLMRRLSEIVSIGFPVLVGTSRKSFLTAGRSEIPVDQREALTAASLVLAVQAGAKIMRVHDVAAQMPVVRWLQAALLYS